MQYQTYEIVKMVDYMFWKKDCTVKDFNSLLLDQLVIKHIDHSLSKIG